MYLGTRHLGRWWRWKVHDCDVCHEDWWLRLCSSNSSGPGSPCVCWCWWRGPWPCVRSLCPCPWVSGDAHQALPAQTLAFLRDKRAHLPHSPLAAGRQLFPSPQHGQALPLPIHLIETTSLLWGCCVLHPSCAPAICPGWQLIWERGAG